MTRRWHDRELDLYDDEREQVRRPRLAPGKRTLTQGIGGGASGSRSPASPGKRTLTSRLAAAKRGRSAETEVPYRGEMESMFGTSFADVDASVGQREPLAALGAQAAAEGNTVAFAAASPSRAQVAHELTHVVQQRQAGTVAAAADRGTTARGHDSEREAEDIAESVARFGTANRTVTVSAAPQTSLALDAGGPAPQRPHRHLIPVDEQPPGKVLVNTKLATLPALPELGIGDKTQINLKLIHSKPHLTAYLHDTKTDTGYTVSLRIMSVLNRLATMLPAEKAGELLRRVTVKGFKVRFEGDGESIKLTIGRHYSQRSYAFFSTHDLIRAAISKSADGLRPTEAHLFVGDKEHGTLARATRFRGKGIKAAQAFDGLGSVIGRPFRIHKPDLRKQIFDSDGENLWLSVRFGGGLLSIVCAEDSKATSGMVASVNIIALGEKLGAMAGKMGAAGKKAAAFIMDKLRALASAGASAARSVVHWVSGILRFKLGSGTEFGWSLGDMLGDLMSSGWNFLRLLPDHVSFGGGSFGAFRMPDLSWLKMPRIGTVPLPGDLIAKLIAMLPKGGGGDSDLGKRIAEKVKAAIIAVGKGVVGVAIKVSDLLGTAAKGAIGFLLDLGKLLGKLGVDAAKLMARVARAGAGALRRWVHVGKDLILRVYDRKKPNGSLVGFDLKQLIDGVGADDLMPVELRLVSGLARIEGQRDLDGDSKVPKSRDRVKVKRPPGRPIIPSLSVHAPEWLQRALVTTDQTIKLEAYGGGRRAVKIYLHTPGHGDDKGDEGGILMTINAQRLSSALGKRLKMSGKVRKRFKISASGYRLRIDWLGKKGSADPRENYVAYSISDFIQSPNIDPSSLVPAEIKISGDGYSLRGGSSLELGESSSDRYGFDMSRLQSYWPAGSFKVPGFIADQIGVPTAHVYLDRGAGDYPRGIFLSGRKLSIQRPKLDPSKPFDPMAASSSPWSKTQQYAPGVELRVEQQVLARVEAKAKKQLGRAGGVAKRMGKTIGKALGSKGAMPAWSPKAEMDGEGLKFTAGAGNWVLFDWGTIIGLVTGQVPWSTVRPHAFSIASGDALLTMGPLDQKNLPPAGPESIKADKFTVAIGELPAPLKRVTKAFGYSDSHYIRIDPDASQILGEGTPRADITADVYVVKNEKPNGIRIRFATPLEPLLRAFLPDQTVDRILSGGGKRQGTGYKVGIDGLVVTVQKSIGKGTRKKELGASFKWDLRTLLEILLNLEDVEDEPSMLLPDALGGFLGGRTKHGHEFRLEFSAKQRALSTPDESPGGTRIDAQLLGMVDSLGMVVPPVLARRARLYVSIPGGLTAAKRIAQTLVSGDLVEMAEVKLMIVGKTDDEPASIYELSLFVDAAVARMIGKFIPYLGLAIKLYESGKDVLGDPKGTIESLTYLPEALKHIFSGRPGEAWGDVLTELSAEEAALLAMLDNTSIKQKVKAARAYERIQDAVGSPTKERIMASAGMPPEKLEALSEAYAKLGEGEVEALGKLIKAAERYNIPLGSDDDFDPADLHLSLDNYQEQIAIYEEAHRSGVKLIQAKKAGKSEDELQDIAKAEGARIEKALDTRRAARGDDQPATSTGPADPDLADAPKHDPNQDRDIHALPPPSRKALAVQEKIFTSDPKGTMSEAEENRLMRKYGGLDQGELAQLLDAKKLEKDGVLVEMPESETWFVRQLLLHLMDPDREEKGTADDGGVLAEYKRRKTKEVASKTGLGRKRVESAAKKNASKAANGSFDPADYSSHDPDSPDFVEDVVAYQKRNKLPRTGIVDSRTQKKHAEKVASGDASRDAMNQSHGGDNRADDAATPKDASRDDKDFDPFEHGIIGFPPEAMASAFEVDGDQVILKESARVGTTDESGRVTTPGIEHMRQQQRLPNGYSYRLLDYETQSFPIPNQAGAWRVMMRFKLDIDRNGKRIRSKTESIAFIYVAGAGGASAQAFPLRSDTRGVAATLRRAGKSLEVKKPGITATIGQAKVAVQEASGSIKPGDKSVLVKFRLEVLEGSYTLLDDANGRRMDLVARREVELSIRIPVSQLK